MAVEVELKLELTPEAVDDLLGCGLLSGEPTTIPQRSIYFDTSEQDLRAAGFSLRIRQSEGQRVQTVKATGAAAAGLFARPEWEQKVGDDLPVLDDTTPIKALLGTREVALRPVFEVVVERRIWTLSQEDAEFELALDRGEVVAGDRHSPFCEIELELKSGSPAALFSYARRINAAVPSPLSVLSKAERGYRLLGPVVRAVKAEPMILASDMTTVIAFRHIAGACLRQFRLNETLIDHRNVEATHQARVALRRLRSAFTLHKSVAQDGQFDRLREDLRWLAAGLGTARDLDVLVARRKNGEIHSGLEEARRQSYEEAITALASPRARDLMLNLSEWLSLGEWLTAPSGTDAREQPLRDFAASVLSRFRRKVRKGGRGLGGQEDAARHQLRKDTKKLRYAAEFFASLFEGKRQKRWYGRFLETLEALQDKLGLLNDAVSAPELLARFGLDKDPEAMSLLAPAEDKESLVEAAADAHDAFADAKPFWR